MSRLGMRPAPEKPRVKKNYTYLFGGGRDYVVPTSQLRDTLLALQPKVMAKLTERHDEPIEDDNFGFRQYVAHRAAAITGRNPESLIRRVYAVMAMEGVATDAEVADALLLACGVHIDHDTTIQTLPGNRKAAYEMVRLRRPGIRKAQLERKAHALLLYRDRVLYPDGKKEPSPATVYRARKRRERELAQREQVAA